MKTSKTILACMLVVSLVFSIMAVSVSAEDATTLSTRKYVYDYNDLWTRWDDNGEITTTARIAFNEGAGSVTYTDKSIIPSLLRNEKNVTDGKYYTVSFDFVIDGPTPYTIPVRNASFSGAKDSSGSNSLYFTSILPFNGEVATAMKADAATDEALLALLHVEDEVGVICEDNKQRYPIINGEASAKSATALTKENLMIYIDYKAGNAGTARNFEAENVTVTIKSPYVADTVFPKGTMFISENGLTHFVSDNWATKNVHYKTSNDTIVSTSAYGGLGLDLAYGVYEAPVSGTYKVLAMKRDRNKSDANQRVYAADIAGVDMIFGVTNCPYESTSDPYYYWEIDDDAPTVTLTKGQRFAIRTLQEAAGYAGLITFAFVPATEDLTSYIGLKQADSKPYSKEDFNTASLQPVDVTASEDITVNFNGQDVVVGKGVAADYFPNVRVNDQNGNFIEQQTALDAIVAAKEATTEELDYGVSDVIPQAMREDLSFNEMPGGMATPMTYDTYLAANGTPWAVTSNSYTGKIWPASQTYFGSGTLTMPVTIYEPGDYYVLTSGSAWETSRYITVKVGSTQMPSAVDNNRFLSDSKGAMTKETSTVATHLDAGTYTMTVKCTGSMRFEYVWLVQAESAEAAAAIHESITDRATFDEYFDYDKDVFVNGKMTSGKILTVNGKVYEGDLDQLLISDGDVITYKPADKTNFKPLCTEGIITGNGGVVAGDAVTGVSNKFVTSLTTFPFDATETDALAGTYLNGYITMDDFATQEFEIDGVTYYLHGTSGDESRVVVVVRDFPIKKSAFNATKSRYELGYNSAAPFVAETLEINGLNYKVGIGSAQLQSDPLEIVDANGNKHTTVNANGETVVTKKSPKYNYDLSHLYLTNSVSAAPLKVTATKTGDGVYQLTTNKTVLVKLITISNDGGIKSVSSVTELLDFMDEDGITVNVADGETVYVWEGMHLIGENDGMTQMVPLTAPLTK
ncbi:MAG: hypothetical protein IJE10_11570 [Clostridia bacterium]|nr:hypothetical protein [Clostridia bacterium]